MRFYPPIDWIVNIGHTVPENMQMVGWLKRTRTQIKYYNEIILCRNELCAKGPCINSAFELPLG